MRRGACHEALQHDAHLSEADKRVVGEITDTLGGSIGSITSTAERQALEPRHLRNGLHWDDGGSHSIFCPHGALICIKSDLVPGCGALATIRQFFLFGLFCALLTDFSLTNY
jgi:hypothetical protein